MASNYRFLKDVFDGTESYVVYQTSGVEAGDLMVWDRGARKAVVMTATASGVPFLGVSQETQPLVGLGSSTRTLTGEMIRVKSQGIHNMNSTTGETYSHLDPLYMGADAQTVSKVGSSRIIGRVWLPDGTQVTGATGTRVPTQIFGCETNQGNLPSATAAVL